MLFSFLILAFLLYWAGGLVFRYGRRTLQLFRHGRHLEGLGLTVGCVAGMAVWGFLLRTFVVQGPLHWLIEKTP
jgi:hypothetical protein